jgi:hypothetical protein
MVAKGMCREVYDAQGNHIGFQFMPGHRDDEVRLSMQSSSGLVPKDIVLNAGRAFKNGKSKTAHLTEEQRVHRVHAKTGKILPPEDAVEKVEAKVRVWPDLAGKKKDILRVWP